MRKAKMSIKTESPRSSGSVFIWGIPLETFYMERMESPFISS